MFIDLKAAFSLLDEEKVLETLAFRGVSEKLRRRIRQRFKETSSKARIKARNREREDNLAEAE